MRRTLVIIILAVASSGVLASSASAVLFLPGPAGTNQYECFRLGALTIECRDYNNEPARYHCSYSNGAFQCTPVSLPATDQGARDLEEALRKAGVGPNSAGLETPPPPAQPSARGSGAPTVAGGGSASASCGGSMDISVPESAASQRVLHVDFGDGASGACQAR